MIERQNSLFFWLHCATNANRWSAQCNYLLATLLLNKAPWVIYNWSEQAHALLRRPKNMENRRICAVLLVVVCCGTFFIVNFYLCDEKRKITPVEGLASCLRCISGARILLSAILAAFYRGRQCIQVISLLTNVTKLLSLSLIHFCQKKQKIASRSLKARY